MTVVPTVLHVHRPDRMGAPSWHPRFEAYIGGCLPPAIQRERQIRRYWWRNPSIIGWLAAQPERFTVKALDAVRMFKNGDTAESVMMVFEVSKSWLQRQALLMENAVLSEFLTGHSA